MIAKPVVEMLLRTVPGEPDAEGNPTEVQRFIPVVHLRCIVSQDDVIHTEEMAVEAVWQLTGNYGDTRSLLDLSVEEVNAVLATWEMSVQNNLLEALTQNPDVVQKAAALLALFGA